MTDPQAASPLLTTDQVASLLQVHPKHVYRLLKKGLPGRKVGGEWRFHRDEVLEWTLDRGSAAREASDGQARPPILAANGDLAVELLLRRLAEPDGPVLGMLRADRDTALQRLRSGQVLLAGYHGSGEADPGSLWAGESLSRIHLVGREVGLAARTSWRLPALTDLLRVRLASRPPTAGVRALLDDALRRTGLSPDDVHESALLLDSHRDVVLAITTGQAQAGVTTRAWAQRAGLAFSTLAREEYGILVPDRGLEDPATQALVEAARRPGFRDALARLGGYDPEGIGEVTPATQE